MNPCAALMFIGFSLSLCAAERKHDTKTGKESQMENEIEAEKPAVKSRIAKGE